ncbi:hypothetical protein L204_100800 [Cryptococcus depauperatus]
MLGAKAFQPPLPLKPPLHNAVRVLSRQYLSTTTLRPQGFIAAPSIRLGSRFVYQRKSFAFNHIRYLSSTPISSTVVHEPDINPATLDTPIPDDLLQPASTFLDPYIHPLSDLLISLPHPLGYGVSIIVITLVVRTVFTLPVSLWQKRRAKRMQDLVAPQISATNERLARSLADDYRRKGLGYTEYLLELRRQMIITQKALHKKYRVQPFITQWTPLLTHIPLFITLSLTIRRAVDLPDSPLASDSFLWLDHLGQADSTGILPLAGMLVAFGNAELVGRRSKDVRNAYEGRVQEKPTEEPKKPLKVIVQAPKGDSNAPTSPLFSSASAAKGKPILTPASISADKPRNLSTSSPILATPRQQKRWQPIQKPMENGNVLVEVGSDGKPPAISPSRRAEIARRVFAQILRFSSIGFAMVASHIPSGVVLYWFTSICYSFFQNVVLNELPRWQAKQQAKKGLLSTSQYVEDWVPHHSYLFRKGRSKCADLTVL